MKEKEGDVHEDAAAERVLGLLDDTVDRHFLDIEHGEHGRAENVHDRLRELVSGARTGGRGRRKRARVCVNVIVLLTGVRSQRQSHEDRLSYQRASRHL